MAGEDEHLLTLRAYLLKSVQHDLKFRRPPNEPIGVHFLFTAEYVKGTNENTVTTETDDPSGYYVNLVGKTRWKVGPIARLDTFADEFRRWTIGGYYGLPNVPLRVMVNYEYRELKDGVRGDDKLYVWTQVRF